MENKELSPIKKAALALLDNLKSQVINDCSDEEISESLTKFHPSSNKEYFNPNLKFRKLLFYPLNYLTKVTL